jgi:hypothetical protein
MMALQRIPIGLGLTNLPMDVDVDELRRFIASGVPDCETYCLRPDPNAVAALDLMLVVNAAGSVASLAALLWMAYEKFIAPKKAKPDNDAGMYLAVRRPDGTNTEFWIGKSDRDRQRFVAEFSRKMTTIAKTDHDGASSQLITEIEESGRWEKMG